MISFEEIERLRKQLADLEQQFWLNHVLFSMQWWILLATFIVPWVIWWMAVDKRNIRTILLYGLVIMTLINIMDHTGLQLMLWSYEYKLTPLIPILSPANLSLLPVLYMLMYQYFRSWRSFITAHIASAAVISFVGEPMFVELGIYHMLNWEHYYSFPIYIAMAALIRWFLEWLLKKCLPNPENRLEL
ncbi:MULTISPECIES: CBO0543 family protein [Paenibacillus]|uniref:CBO0543 family protein n=1 Tax=Paenibacillus TaxID=44249 RepID=UPI002FE08E17